jgi:hypothetical protein
LFMRRKARIAHTLELGIAQRVMHIIGAEPHSIAEQEGRPGTLS